jgi:hypothetical protein
VIITGVNMPTFHIPIIAEVEAETIDAARVLAYKAMDDLVVEKTKFSIADDSRQIKTGQRLIILHPPDADAEYDPEIYEATNK